jgi:hypothetical protein
MPYSHEQAEGNVATKTSGAKCCANAYWNDYLKGRVLEAWFIDSSYFQVRDIAD